MYTASLNRAIVTRRVSAHKRRLTSSRNKKEHNFVGKKNIFNAIITLASLLSHALQFRLGLILSQIFGTFPLSSIKCRHLAEIKISCMYSFDEVALLDNKSKNHFDLLCFEEEVVEWIQINVNGCWSSRQETSPLPETRLNSIVNQKN